MNYVGGDAEMWGKLEKRLRSALEIASDDLESRYHRSLTLGSPVLVGQADRDIIRVPIVLKGGPRESAVAYVQISDVRVDRRRVDALVQRAATLARAALERPSPGGGADVIITYP